ncbi:hypothetical protein ACI6Q2_14895 [Chitinophagaceae bacterium LWZ2-11]
MPRTLSGVIKLLLLLCFCCNTVRGFAQLKLGNSPAGSTTKSALLDLNSSTQGLLLPRLSDTSNTTGINKYAPPDGMFIYFTGDQSLRIRKNGYWIRLTDSSNALQADWNQASATALDFIKNKPTIYSFTGTSAQYTKGDGTYATFPSIYSFTGNTSQYTRGDGTYATFPTIPAAQIQSDWNQAVTTSLDYIKNKPAIYSFTGTSTQYTKGDGTYATFPTIYSFTGNTSQYTRGDGTYATFPTIPAAQIQSDWNQATTTSLDYIKNKPAIYSFTGNTSQYTKGDGTYATFPTIYSFTGTSAQYTKGDGTYATFPTIYSFTGTSAQYTKGDGTYATFPTIPAAQIQSDWNQAVTTSLDYIKNKPAIYSFTGTSTQYTKGDGTYATFPTIPAAQIQSDWNQAVTTSLDYIKNKPAIYSFTGTSTQYTKGDGTYATFPTIPAAQIQSDWNQATTSSLDYIKNKPAIYSFSGTAAQYTKGDGTYATFPTIYSFTGTSAQYTKGDGTYGTLPVTGVFGRTGAITAAANDYNFNQLAGSLAAGQDYTTGVTAGTYNNVTVNTTGRVTSGSNIAYLTGNQSITWTGSGDVSGTASGTTSISPTLTLATVNSNVGSFGTASSVPTVTVNGKGLVTAAANTPIQITESQVTNLTTDLASKQAQLNGTGYVKAAGTTITYDNTSYLPLTGGTLTGGLTGTTATFTGNTVLASGAGNTTTIGNAGTPLNAILQFTNQTLTINKTIGYTFSPGVLGLVASSITPASGGISASVTITANGVNQNASITVTPRVDLPAGVTIGWARAPAANQITINFTNSSMTTQTLTTIVVDITVIQ